MAVSTPPRHILHELPINARRTPSISYLLSSSITNVKRNITEVEDSAAAPVPSRLRLSKRTETSCLKSTHPPSTSAATTACGRACGGREDGVIEENTRETSNDTVSTIENSDIEGDTVDTQQTAATEPSQATDTEPLSVCHPSYNGHD
ncbi:MAG: hypothetical protein Q9196_004227 [Gyalolechia fulgens]